MLAENKNATGGRCRSRLFLCVEIATWVFCRPRTHKQGAGVDKNTEMSFTRKCQTMMVSSGLIMTISVC